MQVIFYKSPEYRLAFGNAFIFFDMAGQPVGFYDYYNFDWKDFGERDLDLELKTRAVDIAGNVNGAKNFHIAFGKYVKS